MAMLAPNPISPEITAKAPDKKLANALTANGSCVSREKAKHAMPATAQTNHAIAATAINED